MHEHIKVQIPRIVSKKEEFYISINKEIIGNDSNILLRIDAYPCIAPKHMKRHFGYVDIPAIKIIENDGKPLVVNQKIIEINDESYTFNLPFWENGGVVWHISLWRDEKLLPYPIVARQFYWFDKEDIKPDLKSAIITTSEQCNLKCTMCGRQVLPPEHSLLSSRFMMKPFEAKTIVDNLGGLRSVLLLGSGEPLLNKDIVEIARIFRCGIGSDGEINIGTNGTLLTAKMAESLLDADLSGLGVSIDGATAETYEAIRIGANFDAVIDNIRHFLILMKAREKQTHIWANYVVQPKNIHECEAFVILCKNIGIYDIRFTLVQSYSKNNENSKKENIIRNLFKEYDGNPKEIIESTRKKAMYRAKTLGIQCSFDRFNFTDEGTATREQQRGNSNEGTATREQQRGNRFRLLKRFILPFCRVCWFV